MEVNGNVALNHAHFGSRQ